MTVTPIWPVTPEAGKFHLQRHELLPVDRSGWVALLATVCSLASYAPFLWNTTPVSLGVVAVGES